MKQLKKKNPFTIFLKIFWLSITARAGRRAAVKLQEMDNVTVRMNTLKAQQQAGNVTFWGFQLLLHTASISIGRTIYI